jgi:hypothetical protein
LQQPDAQLVASHTHAPATHRCPLPQMLPPGPHEHAPATQRSAEVVLHIWQALPPEPQVGNAGVVQELPLQQPAPQLLESQTQVPPEHHWPAAHDAPEPHLHVLPTHPSASVPLQSPRLLQPHAAATQALLLDCDAQLRHDGPHAVFDVPDTHWLPQHAPDWQSLLVVHAWPTIFLHWPAMQTWLPATHAAPEPHLQVLPVHVSAVWELQSAMLLQPQLPLAQMWPLLLAAQLVPHAPQFDASVLVLISQPSICLLLLQSAKPVVHAPPWQLPARHERVMFCVEHVVPHAPQLSTSVLVLISQPLVCLLLSQSAKPVLQTPAEQLELLHARVMFCVEQTMPQPPHASALLVVFVSQPSVRLLLLQSAKPVVQTPISHEPLTQVRAMFVGEQAPEQLPQLSTSLFVSISQPSVCLLLLQSAKPFAHMPLHTPAPDTTPHVRVAMFVDEQLMLQPLQLFGLVKMLISHPLLRLFESQSAKPVMQVPTHWLLEHDAVAMLLQEHDEPQAPQLAMVPAPFVQVWAWLLVMLISQPFARLFMSQSANPAVHVPPSHELLAH